MPVVPVLEGLRQEDRHELEASLDYTEFKISLSYTGQAYLQKQKNPTS